MSLMEMWENAGYSPSAQRAQRGKQLLSSRTDRNKPRRAMLGTVLRHRMLLSWTSKDEQLCARWERGSRQNSPQISRRWTTAAQQHNEDAGLRVTCLACYMSSATRDLYTSMHSWFSKASVLLLSPRRRLEGLPVLISQHCGDLGSALSWECSEDIPRDPILNNC